MSSRTLGIFIFGLVAICTASHDLLSTKIEENVSKLQGAALQLVNFDATAEQLTQTFTSLINTITVTSIPTADYSEALKVIVSQKYLDQGMDAETVSAELQSIEDSIFELLKANSSDAAEEMAKAANRIVELTKARLIGILKANRDGQKASLDYSDRVSHLKSNVNNRLIDAYNNKQITGDQVTVALSQLKSGLPATSEGVKTVVDAYKSSANFLMYPSYSFEAAIKAQIGSVEADPATLTNAPAEISDRIKETISIWLSEPTNRPRGLEVAKTILSDLKEMQDNAVQTFGAENAVAGTNGARIFLTDLIAHIFSTVTTTTDKANLSSAFEIATNYFSTRILRYPTSNLATSLEHFYDQNARQSFDLKSDTKFIIFRKLQKYTGVAIVVNAGSALDESDQQAFVNNFSIFSDLTATEFAALNLLQYYFANAKPIDYSKSDAFFGLAFAEFTQFLADSNQSELTQLNVYQLFDNFLVSRVSEAQGEAKWLYPLLRLANQISGGSKSPAITLEPLNEDGQAAFTEMLNTGVFDAAYKKLLSIVMKTVNVKDKALVAEHNASKDLVKRQEIVDQLTELRKQTVADKLINDAETAPTPEQLAEIFKRFIEALKSGYNLAANKRLLI